MRTIIRALECLYNEFECLILGLFGGLRWEGDDEFADLGVQCSERVKPFCVLDEI